MNVTTEATKPRWRVGSVRHDRTPNGERVTADLAGTPVWFESADAPLAPSPEAFVGLLLLPAIQAGAAIDVEDPLDPKWRDGVARLPTIWSGWWGGADRDPIATPRVPPEALDAGLGASARPASGAGACFTGGLDSFYTLLTNRARLDHLVFVHGYDIALDDGPRAAAFERSFRAVAQSTGKRAVWLRSNLRQHPLVASVNWERSHGAPLAAAGLVLAPAIGSLTIPSSYRLSLLRPWGSHPDTDPLWSSTRVAMVHDDATYGREDKLRRIVDEPMLATHLRVCWENRTPSGNCSACLKCVRTMVALAAYGRLADYTVFDRSVPVEARLDAIARIPEHLILPWGNLLELDPPPGVRRALERLFARSRDGHAKSLARRVVRWARRAAGRAH